MHILWVNASLWSYSDIVLEFDILVNEALLFPLHILIKYFHYIFILQWKHEQSIRVTLHRKSIPKKQLIVVELAIVQSHLFPTLQSIRERISVEKIEDIFNS